MIQSFASMGITTVIWWLVGYSLCFSGGSDGIYGNFHLAFLRHVGPHSIYAPSGIPMVVLIAYQMMFAIITPALITGAFTNRVTFKAYLIFLVVWQLFVYYPFVHMIWGGGLLAHWGVARLRGRHRRPRQRRLGGARLRPLRRQARASSTAPHNIPFIALGTGLLWFGWYGFNAGSELKVDAITAHRVPEHRPRGLVRRHHLAVHRMVEREEAALRRAAHGRGRRPRDDHAGGRLRADLGVGGHRHRRRGRLLLRRALKNRLNWDDALDVWGVHGVGGFLGIILLGVFAGTAINPDGGVGLVHGTGVVLRQAGRGGRRLLGLRLRLHLRDAEGDRPDRAGAGQRKRAGSTRRCTARAPTSWAPRGGREPPDVVPTLVS